MEVDSILGWNRLLIDEKKKREKNWHKICAANFAKLNL